MKVRIGINGFGRIGRSVARIAARDPRVELVAVNDPSLELELALHLFKYDTNYGTFDGTVERLGEARARLGDDELSFFAERSPEAIPWGELGVPIVLECSGVFRRREQAEKHLEGGARFVAISAPAKGDQPVPTFVMGVNHHLFDPERDTVVSNASCTTNCLAPLVHVIHQDFGIVRGLMSTIHAYTNGQALLDTANKDWRRARAAAENIVPTTTGAAKAIGLVIPELKGKLDGIAYRVPVSTVSVVDLVAEVSRPTTKEEVNQALARWASGELAGILGICEEPLVSTDFKGSSLSSIVDAALTEVMDGTLVKAVAWYDNEWGYSCRLVDLAVYMAEKAGIAEASPVVSG